MGIASELASGTGCGVLLVGGPGSGKSFMARRALEQLGQNYVVVQVRGTAASKTLHYGALSVLLNDLEPVNTQQPLMVLRGLTQLLHKKAQGKGIVLFVDNAHELDELSAMTIAHLSSGGHVRLLAACADLQLAGGEIQALCKDDLLRRINVLPFDFDETAALLRLRFGGTFSQTAVRALWHASGGNALFLTTAAKEQIRQGTLVRQDDTWLLGDEHAVPGDEIREIVKARLNLLSAGQRDVFELLALAGSVPLRALMSVSDPRDIDSLQEASVIAVGSDHLQTVTIADAVSAGIAAGVVPPGRSSELRRRLTAVMDPDRMHEQELMDAVWALDCGEHLTAGSALSAARAANNASDPATALRFLTGATAHEVQTAAALETARAHLALDDREAALMTLRGLDRSLPSGMSAGEWTDVQLAIAELSTQAGATTDGAHLRLREVEARLDRQAPGTHGDPTLRARLRVAEADLAAMQGRYQDVVTLLGGVDASELGRERQIRATALQCMAWAVLGDSRRALGLGAQIAQAAADTHLPDRVVREVRALLLQVWLLLGELAKCQEYLKEMSAANEPPSRLGGMFEIAPGVLLFHRGHVKSGLHALEAGARQLLARDHDGVAVLALAAGAYAAALLGKKQKTEALLAGMDGLPAGTWMVSRLAAYYAASARVESREQGDLTGLLLSEALCDAQSGAVAPALHFLSAAARQGSQPLARELRLHADRSSGSFAVLCAKFADGLASGDSEALLAVSRDAEAAGNVLMARDAARKAVLCAGESGNRLILRVAQRAQQSFEDRFCGASQGLHSLVTSVLTTREREVAKAAAAGISNRRLAEQMHVSIRTIEGHLYQVYAKLHVASRAELKEVLLATSAGPSTRTGELQRRLP
ncbi:LuxR C-terminal-related transcriptional regulator [Pseudarthrobacter sp. NPDC092439]|uniref:LuxR C-terminal-related transcriptional regulator n=1 Tax=unclassified Pseudarthrobacter TaxID=2647000 RepID=UPI0037FA73D5